ncbi:hypothetical protein DRN46_06660 [Thermococci archaeon]|nr:MAG: hypothetical protein DRN46_06660 [Thermococci archaeon]
MEEAGQVGGVQVRYTHATTFVLENIIVFLRTTVDRVTFVPMTLVKQNSVQPRLAPISNVPGMYASSITCVPITSVTQASTSKTSAAQKLSHAEITHVITNTLVD